ncbi:MAG: hypothetical protein NTY36_05785 [Deltaproteobacteria bacterium]|nr:hypothetical protein [Deltaproteobacteria bacterium]
MTNCRKVEFYGAFFLVLCTLFFSACAGGQGTQHLVVTEYVLTDAGFKAWEVNDTTPKRQAMLDAIPRGKITTFSGDGEVYHVYADEGSKTLYVGDEAAYQKYLSLAKGRQLCERVDAPNSVAFWSCFDDVKQPGGGQGRK